MKFFSFFLCFYIMTSSLFAFTVQEHIDHLIDEKKRLEYNKLLVILFEDKEKFYHYHTTIEDEVITSINLTKLTQTLKENGLLQLFYTKPTRIETSFTLKNAPSAILKVLFEVLQNLGYQYVLTQSLTKNSETFSWRIEFTSQSAIDPTHFGEELAKYGIRIEDINNESFNWHYHLDASLFQLSNIIELTNNKKPMKKIEPLGEYWLSVEDNATHLYVKSDYPNVWYPHLVCYNGDLEILKNIQRKSKTKRFRLSLPESTKYIRIRDSFTAENLKHGITVNTKGE